MTSENRSFLKYFDVIAAVLLVIGGLNWGLYGFFGVDLVAQIFGGMSVFSRIIYSLVGLAALYQAIQYRAIARRWECRWAMPRTEGSAA